MANGNFSLGTDNVLTGRVVWSATANGTVANSSTVTATIQVARAYGSSYTTGGTFKGSLTIGSTKKSFSKYAECSTSWVTLYSFTIDVPHNNDGVGTCYIAGTINGAAGTTMEDRTVSASKTVTLDKIARAASIVSAPNFTDEENPTITYNNPAEDAVEKLEACISLTGERADIAYRDIPTGETSYTFNLTEAERNILREATLDGSTSREVKFYVRTTLAGSVYTASLARTFTVVNAAPDLSVFVMDANEDTVALTGDRLTALIKGYSNAAYEMQATPKKGASIVSYVATSGGKQINLSSGTFEKVEANSFTFTVTDDRGLSASQTITLNMVDYFKPTCDTEIKLELDTETTIRADLRISGKFYNGSFGYESNSLEILVKHSAAEDWISLQNDLYFDYSTNGNTYYIDFGISNLDYTEPFTYQCKVVDKLDSATSAEDTVSYNPIFDWSKEDFNINVPLNMSGNTVLRHTDANKVVLSAEGADIYLRPNGTSVDEGQLRLFTDGSATLNGSKIVTVDLLYPVGSIYMSINNTNPSVLFGGTWEQIKDTFLLAAGSAYAAGSTGGKATHTLTVDEMPSHRHSSHGQRCTSSTSGPVVMRSATFSDAYTDSTSYTEYTGGGKAHNNMPPYLAVYMWKRTK